MQRVIAVVGPTAVGKTKLSIDLARHLATEIVSGDSMLVYRGMDIGTAKPSLTERCGIVHHLIDILDARDEYSVVDFQRQATYWIENINTRGKIPVLAGGTGLYIKALLEGYRFNRAPENTALRLHLAAMANEHGPEYVHRKLAAVDPATAARLHPNDTRRVIRALEVRLSTGESVSQANQSAAGSLIFDALVIGLNLDRHLLYQRIEERVNAMISQGLVEEVSALLASGVPEYAQSMQGIGYKEVVSYLQGEIDLPTAVDKIKQATRNFAKRQLTWYRKMPYIEWYDAALPYENLLEHIYSRIAGKFHVR
ncbi:MAG: tRNA (adenosine(37)-N6)-dimethylallyltransferase MiaA [Negativicutes bacterium]|nr:tRNA (adenosine(37)-N6)-dimethylallyltransferase MiaA [Negativicutes bacterium]